MKIEIIYPSEKYFKSFHEALSVVAKERIYIEMIEAPPIEKVALFQNNLISKDGPVYCAVNGDHVVGWCDVFPLEKVELNVYTTNLPAIALYKNFEFEEEGLIRKFRKLDGQYFDCLAMGKFL